MFLRLPTRGATYVTSKQTSSKKNELRPDKYSHGPHIYICDHVIFRNTIGISPILGSRAKPHSGTIFAGCATFVVACVCVCVFRTFSRSYPYGVVEIMILFQHVGMIPAFMVPFLHGRHVCHLSDGPLGSRMYVIPTEYYT